MLCRRHALVCATIALSAPGVAAAKVELDLTAHPSEIFLGEGWGCASVASDVGNGWQCWRAKPVAERGRSGPEPLHAWRVPWVERVRPQFGPDRLCALAGREIKCWMPPATGETEPREWHAPAARTPAAGARPDAGAAPPDAAPAPSDAAGALQPPPPASSYYWDADTLYNGWVGGTFACAARWMSDVWCAGDNTFGQLGFEATSKNAPLLGIEKVNGVAFGAWHACVTHEDYRGDSSMLCWGRGDAGQLGFAPTDRCAAGGRELPCARKPTPSPLKLRMEGLVYAPGRGPSSLRAGDLFTCLHQMDGIYCWGGSRDGFFGTSAACPVGLSRAWPTSSGATVAAPHAACAVSPVKVRGSDRLKSNSAPGVGPQGKPAGPGYASEYFDVGPRGLCQTSGDGKVWCRGAVPLPRKPPAISTVKVSPGSDASACAITRGAGEVLCWGESYSRPGASAEPVRIAFAPFPPEPVNPNPFSIDHPKSKDEVPWAKHCLVYHQCPVVAETIAACAEDVHARPWAEMASATTLKEGQHVSVSGPLGLGGRRVFLVGCSSKDPKTGKPLPFDPCCSREGSWNVVLGTHADWKTKRQLRLEGYACDGDTSRTCCNVAVNGQTVVATGTLRKDGDMAVWKLEGVKLCAPAAH